MIKNIVFDIGNVLTGFQWEAFYRSFGFDEETLRKLALATVKSSAWCEFDRGVLTMEELIETFQHNDPSICKEIEMVMADVKGMLIKYEYACPWVMELKERGYAVYVISNMSEKSFQDCRETMNFVDMMDGVILSYQEKLIKPEEAIYRLLQERFGLVLNECVFLDDTKANVSAAEQLGIYGILFQNYEQARSALDGLLASQEL